MAKKDIKDFALKQTLGVNDRLTGVDPVTGFNTPVSSLFKNMIEAGSSQTSTIGDYDELLAYDYLGNPLRIPAYYLNRDAQNDSNVYNVTLNSGVGGEITLYRNNFTVFLNARIWKTEGYDFDIVSTNLLIAKYLPFYNVYTLGAAQDGVANRFTIRTDGRITRSVIGIFGSSSDPFYFSTSYPVK